MSHCFLALLINTAGKVALLSRESKCIHIVLQTYYIWGLLSSLANISKWIFLKNSFSPSGVTSIIAEFFLIQYQQAFKNSVKWSFCVATEVSFEFQLQNLASCNSVAKRPTETQKRGCKTRGKDFFAYKKNSAKLIHDYGYFQGKSSSHLHIDQYTTPTGYNLKNIISSREFFKNMERVSFSNL